MAWWDISNQLMGGHAPAIYQYLTNISPTFDWTPYIERVAREGDAMYPDGGWKDPSRGASANIAGQIVQYASDADPQAAAQGFAYKVPALRQQAQQQTDAIIKEQASHGHKGLFGGKLGTILGIGGLALGGLGLAGIGPLAGLGGAAGGADLAGAAGAFDAAGIGTGIDAGIMSSTAGLGAAGLGAGASLGDLGTTDLGIGQALGPTMGEDVAGAASVGGGAGATADFTGTQGTLGSVAGDAGLTSPETTNFIPGLSPGETTGQALGGVTAGGAGGGGGSLLDWFHGIANTVGSNITNNPFSLASSALQYMLGQKNAKALGNLASTIQSTSNPLAQPQRSPFQALALNTAQNPLTGPFSDAYLKAGQSLIDANIAKTGNPTNVFASKIPQILTGMSGDYNNYLNTLMGFGGFNQGVGSAGSNLTQLAPLTAGVNTSQFQGLDQAFKSLFGGSTAGTSTSMTGGGSSSNKATL